MTLRRRFPALWVAAALIVVPNTSASADVTPSPQATPKVDPYKIAHEQFKRDREIYFAALNAREMKMREINTAFKIAVDKASLDAKSSMVLAATPEKKNAISTTRRGIISAAIVARESAIAALGPLPTPPVEPTRPSKGVVAGMSDEKSKSKR